MNSFNSGPGCALLGRDGPVEGAVAGLALDKEGAARLHGRVGCRMASRIIPAFEAAHFEVKVGGGGSVRTGYQQIVAEGWSGTACHAGCQVAGIKPEVSKGHIAQAFQSPHQIVAGLDGSHRDACLDWTTQVHIDVAV